MTMIERRDLAADFGFDASMSVKPMMAIETLSSRRRSQSKHVGLLIQRSWSWSMSVDGRCKHSISAFGPQANHLISSHE